MVPVRIRQLPRFLSQTAARLAIGRRTLPDSATIHLCYFTCKSYYPYHLCSLDSLRRLGYDSAIKVHVFCDEQEMFSPAQIECMKEILPNLDIISWPKSQGWGSNEIRNIWLAYEHVCRSAGERDYVARVDSDVFFLADWLFRLVLKSGADLFGDGHYVNFSYIQGGCYFLSVPAIRTLCAEFHSGEALRRLSPTDVLVEDVALFRAAEAQRLEIRMMWFMMFPDEYRNAGSIGPYERWKFACLHYAIRDKRGMLAAYESLLSVEERLQLRQRLTCA
ncbi:MAG TPA: hypothetical protein VD970_07730 [Acetobacteraceae bacterium]|nr:hypothetical protein [Acetobacteraceae bacterium]